ncbi:hypothetical protein HK096_006171, partial [Nowakowskiella sp. JEL0078]
MAGTLMLLLVKVAFLVESTDLGIGRTAFLDLLHLVSKHAGKPVVYVDLSEADYKAQLVSFGLPEIFASILAACDAAAGE